ncbi:PcfJ domain-containing protein [Polaribacter aestuariivivens]|uniref:PcfJ domain-containing protein n=1 Tax=Polaribacter aestuariivivens TaxID=2304626 RepID=UPI003F49080A
MKPTNKLQRRVLDLSLNYTLPINQIQKDWAYQNCLEHKGYANKTNAFCLDCGETFSHDLIYRKRAVCPNCSTRLKIENTNYRTHKQHTFFAIAEIVEEFQVIKNYELKSYHKKGEKVRYFLQPILEYWIQPNLKYTMVGLCHNLQGYCDSWGGDWSIRKERGYYHNKYEVYPRLYYPKSNFKKEYLKYGINHNLKHLTFIEAVKIAPKVPKVETLLKAKQYSLANKGNSYQLESYWPSIKICLRNKYKVKNASDWIDYIELLKYFNKDLRNAKYVCPKNLKKEHDRLVKKKRVIQEREKLERKRKKVSEAQKRYKELKSMFFGLKFSDGEIVVKVLETVQEFMEEGDVLKHCLFTNEYYNKKDSLVLSARIEEKPIETIEISLSKMKVVQSRGLNNKATEYNNRIVKLIKKNLKTIKSIKESNYTNELLAS